MISADMKMDNEGKRLIGKIDGLSKETVDAIFNELVIGANEIRNEVVKSMSGTERAPWFYKRGGKKHFPSAPFNPPAIDGGDLIKPTNAIIDVRRLDAEIEYAFKLPYAEWLTTGTKKMKKRPFLEPAKDKEWPRIRKNILRAAEEAAKP